MLTPQGKYLADFFVFERDGEHSISTWPQSIAPRPDPAAEHVQSARRCADRADRTCRCGAAPAPRPRARWPIRAIPRWAGGFTATTGGDDGTDWDALRVAHCIPETGIELTPDTFILEAGFERLNGVDFRKGCYVGQEVTARMKHKTELRKGLATCRGRGHGAGGQRHHRRRQAGRHALHPVRRARPSPICASTARTGRWRRRVCGCIIRRNDARLTGCAPRGIRGP